MKIKKITIFYISLFALLCQVCQTTIRGRITALAFSHLEEGEAANCVLIGTQAGLVRLYSSWDLTHIRDVFGASMYSDALLCFVKYHYFAVLRIRYGRDTNS